MYRRTPTIFSSTATNTQGLLEGRTKLAIFGPRAIFEVHPRAKNVESGKENHYTHRSIPKYARNTKKADINYFGCTQGHLEGRTKLAIFRSPGLFLRCSPWLKI